MRKLLFTTKALLLGIIVFMSCNKSDLNTGGSSESNRSAATAKTLASTSRTSCPDCYDHTLTGFNGVNTGTALMMSENYKQDIQPLINLGNGELDANSIWFSLESLKNFIWKIEQSACNNGCSKQINLGIRVYYAKYPDQFSGELSTLNPGFVKHHTLFMVPTFQDPNNNQIHWDFDPWHWGANPCRPTTMSEYFNNSPSGGFNPKPFGTAKSLIFTINEPQYFKSGTGLTAAMNHGELIPPSPPAGTGY